MLHLCASYVLKWIQSLPVCLPSFGPGAKDPSDPTDEERSLSSPVLPLDMLPSLNSPLPSPSTSSPPPHTAPRIRARRFHRFIAPFPMRHSCGGGGGGGCCCCCNCNWRSFRPRRSKLRIYRPGKRKWEHLPVVMRPCRWYQVVGSMQCIHCEARGRHQLTSWMCQSCHVPLCLMPYRNCYAKWHDQRCWVQRMEAFVLKGEGSRSLFSMMGWALVF